MLWHQVETWHWQVEPREGLQNDKISRYNLFFTLIVFSMALFGEK